MRRRKYYSHSGDDDSYLEGWIDWGAFRCQKAGFDPAVANANFYKCKSGFTNVSDVFENPRKSWKILENPRAFLDKMSRIKNQVRRQTFDLENHPKKRD